MGGRGDTRDSQPDVDMWGGVGGGGGGSPSSIVGYMPGGRPVRIWNPNGVRKPLGVWRGGGGWHNIRFFAFGGAYCPLASAHSDPLWVRTCFGRVNGAPGSFVSLLRGSAVPETGLLPVPLTRGIQMHTPSPCGGLPTPALTCAHWSVRLQDHVPDRGF